MVITQAKCPKCNNIIASPRIEIIEGPISGTSSRADIYIVSCNSCNAAIGVHIPIDVDLAIMPSKRLTKTAQGR